MHAALTVTLAMWLAFVTSPVRAMGCSITSTAHIVFGAYAPRDEDALDTTGSVTFECSDVGASDRIEIRLDRGDSESFLPRRMRHRTSRLDYNLYVDAARTRIWGDGTSSTSVYSARPPEGRAVAVPIFARIPARQNVSVGIYRDSVTLTILY